MNKNLKPFKKGYDERRCAGRKQGTENSSTRLMRIFNLVVKSKNPLSGETEEYTILEKMDLKQVTKALKGDTRAYECLLDRFEGRPKQEVKQEVVGGDEIKVNIIQKSKT